MSADERLRLLLRTDPAAAVDQVLSELGGGGLVGPMLDAARVRSLLAANLDTDLLCRVVADGVCGLRWPADVVDAVAGRPDLPDEVVVDAFIAASGLTLRSALREVAGDRAWAAFAAVRHPVAAAMVLTVRAHYDSGEPAPFGDTAGDRAARAAGLHRWLRMLRELPEPTAATAVVLEVAPTWQAPAIDLFALAAGVAGDNARTHDA